LIGSNLANRLNNTLVIHKHTEQCDKIRKFKSPLFPSRKLLKKESSKNRIEKSLENAATVRVAAFFASL
jgi:5-formaminoimidazole-4-carboxamide-1-beta-D-ribofuranosyl 5'-monophosphate synthetase